MTLGAPGEMSTRIRAIDWLRGLVMVLMTIDHAGTIYDSHHMHGDSAAGWVPGSPLPEAEFLTRWVTHLCAPVFVLLAGASLALSSEKRRGETGQTAFMIRRGLFIAALDPLWMGLGFVSYRVFPLMVLYAIGLSMVFMAGLRRLSTPALALLGGCIAIFGELSTRVAPRDQPWRGLWRVLWTAGPPLQRVYCAYPVLPWLSIMIAGWVLGRWLLAGRARTPAARARGLLLVGLSFLVLFAVLRGLDGYGNWGLYRDSTALLQWLHVAKYPPSLAFMALELGLGLVLLAFFFALDDGGERRLLAPLGLLGSTAFFYYLLHVHLLDVADYVFHIDHETYGLAKTYLGAAAVLGALYPLCRVYRRYKTAHPQGWTRYV
jgi:uncharacterized membrane protein